MTELIAAQNLVKSYGRSKAKALDGINLSINTGECFGLIGPNGAGKTTLMSCLLALVRPDSGTVTIGGVSPDDLAVRRICGFMPERPNFEFWMTAREFVKYHHVLSLRPGNTIDADVDETLKLVELEPAAWSRKVNKFSRGMLQRVGLAQALIGKPKILFLDEPSSGMDPPGVALLRNILTDLKAQNVTVILNSHHLDEMERVCDRVAFIRSGKIEAIESLDRKEDDEHKLFIRWLTDDVSVSSEILWNAAHKSDTHLLEYGENWARFSVADTRSAAKLIRELVTAGVLVQAATPEHSSLERFFNETNETGQTKQVQPEKTNGTESEANRSQP